MKRKNIRKAELAKQISDPPFHTAVMCEKVINGFCAEIKDRMKNGERIEIKRFGSFWISERKARPGRNIKAGTDIIIPKRKVLNFRPFKDMLKK